MSRPRNVNGILQTLGAFGVSSLPDFGRMRGDRLKVVLA
jgi:hypothetical protein